MAQTNKGESKEVRPRQEQGHQPGLTEEMNPKPRDRMQAYRGSAKLAGKVALVTGGDSGIGRAACVAFAKEGADVVVVYYNEHEDAAQTRAYVQAEGRQCLTLAGDVSDPGFCERMIRETVGALGGLQVLVNNAAMQFPTSRVEDITPEQLVRTFSVNIFSHFYAVRSALPFLGEGAAIINTTSVTAYRGSSHLIDYAATKGAIVAFTRSLALNLVKRGIRVNAVAPGPIWTPLIPATFPGAEVSTFGSDVPMKRAGEPDECGPCFVFLASGDSSYITGQVLHPNGGEIING